jgi:hypothetical protein
MIFESQISKNVTTIAISRWDMKCRLGVRIEESGLSFELSGLRLSTRTGSLTQGFPCLSRDWREIILGPNPWITWRNEPANVRRAQTTSRQHTLDFRLFNICRTDGTA